jgi:hypothetical protein
MKSVAKISPAWHAEAAAELSRDFAEVTALSLTAQRRRAYLGLKCLYVKMRGKADGSIPHGHFMSWVRDNCPAVPYRTLGDYMGEAQSVCERMNWQIGEIRQFDIPPHKLLELTADGLEAPARKDQQMLFDLLDGKGKFRAVTEYKQVEEDGDGILRPKVGRRKGSNGNPKAIRQAAQERDDHAALVDIMGKMEEFTEILNDNRNLVLCSRVDELPGGALALSKFQEAVSGAHFYFLNLMKGRGNHD